MDERGAATAKPQHGCGGPVYQLTEAVLDATVLCRGGKRTWFLGTNIPGKPQAAVMWLGGVGSFREVCDAAADGGYQVLVLDAPAARTATVS